MYFIQDLVVDKQTTNQHPLLSCYNVSCSIVVHRLDIGHGDSSALQLLLHRLSYVLCAFESPSARYLW